MRWLETWLGLRRAHFFLYAKWAFSSVQLNYILVSGFRLFSHPSNFFSSLHFLVSHSTRSLPSIIPLVNVSDPMKWLEKTIDSRQVARKPHHGRLRRKLFGRKRAGDGDEFSSAKDDFSKPITGDDSDGGELKREAGRGWKLIKFLYIHSLNIMES